MKAMKFPEAGRAEIVDVQVPNPGSGEVLVKVRAAGICASDVAAFKGTHNFRRPPVITGHELAGEIVKLGPDSAGRRAGDGVALEPHVGCGRCDYCRQDNYHECPEKWYIGVGDWIGAFAEYVVARAPSSAANTWPWTRASSASRATPGPARSAWACAATPTATSAA